MECKKRKLLTVREAAELIDGLTQYRVRQMCISGQLPCFKAGNRLLITEENLFKAVFGDNIAENNKDEKSCNLSL